MSRICPQCPDAKPSDRWAQADVVLQEEPDEDEDEEEDEPDREEDDEDEDTDDGYSECACPYLCQWVSCFAH